MMNMADLNSDPRIVSYLTALRQALDRTAPNQTEGVLAEINEHIVETVRDGQTGGHEVDIESIIRSLGPVESIANAAGSAPYHSPEPTPRPRFLGTRLGAIVTVLALTFGGLILPVLGWIVGLVMLWSSPGWRRRDKLIGTIVSPSVWMVTIIFGFMLWSSPSDITTVCLVGASCSPGVEATSFGFGQLVSVALLVSAPLLVAARLLLTFKPRDSDNEIAKVR